MLGMNVMEYIRLLYISDVLQIAKFPMMSWEGLCHFNFALWWFLPGLLCKTLTDLKWVLEFSPGNIGGTSIFSCGAAVMRLLCPELAALENKYFYGQTFPIKKSSVCHLALVCLWSSVLWCLFSASWYSDDFEICTNQKLYPLLWKFCIFFTFHLWLWYCTIE